jgi:hypothetical protein
MAGRNTKPKTAMNFASMRQADLEQIEPGTAIKVPLAQLKESKAKVRSALNRATRKNGHQVATASDDTYLYVWNELQ